MRMLEEKVRKIVDILRSREEVRFAYLFGSAARGRYGGLSDIDVAVYPDPSLPEEGIDGVAIHLASELSFRDVRVDLVVLNRANPRLAFEAIRGRLLFSKDEGLRKEFVYRTLKGYLDRRAARLRMMREEVSRDILS